LEAGQSEQKWQSKDDQVGEGLMEALAVHPTDKIFVMSGRLRGGAFNTGVFSVESGELLHGFKSDSRVTEARFLQDGRTLVLAGALNQSADAAHQFGIVDIFGLQAVDESEAGR